VSISICTIDLAILILFFKLYIYLPHPKTFLANLNYKISIGYNKIKYICCYKL
jgi:hypothetical protein